MNSRNSLLVIILLMLALTLMSPFTDLRLLPAVQSLIALASTLFMIIRVILLGINSTILSHGILSFILGSGRMTRFGSALC